MRVLSSAIREGEPIPRRFTCEGENILAEFYWEGAPRETKAFVLILHDPDAPRNDGFTHWLLYNIPPNITRISENLSKQSPAVDSGLRLRQARLYRSVALLREDTAILLAYAPYERSSTFLPGRAPSRFGWPLRAK
jgi:phosphatidylethanolamine-binding protein (PEBP) family uncharacterized protein